MHAVVLRVGQPVRTRDPLRRLMDDLGLGLGEHLTGRPVQPQVGCRVWLSQPGGHPQTCLVVMGYRVQVERQLMHPLEDVPLLLLGLQVAKAAIDLGDDVSLLKQVGQLLPTVLGRLVGDRPRGGIDRTGRRGRPRL